MKTIELEMKNHQKNTGKELTIIIINEKSKRQKENNLKREITLIQTITK